ncbi:probable tRNA (guanine(26)-N(2))-dimethyltransferase 1 [Zingiber officinale]|uniref:tRNA (guanine(26)-N(2))-dimethyltransferase n=1 Tax=Zingiber officinale TaxID=94328 RepID=A0A8J5EWG7_ZINOF|nr:probable tRNA (guanine(26)-N(2))-dimethyltransferase 1 [Zingiber officinale]KAG6475510.1 hypothetical protein ZIOFF_064732 [Zingiber officinale]
MGAVEDELGNYTIIKEGEAEILMHSSNTVFFNKAQVYNRDMSIAVLRTFIDKRKEHDAYLSKKGKPLNKNLNGELSESITLDGSSGAIEDEKINGATEEKVNGGIEVQQNQYDGIAKVTQEGEEKTTSEECIKIPSLRGKQEPKPPIVLEALAASGLRALRYSREIEGIGKVIALDNDKASIEACNRNIKFNGFVACSKVDAYLADARVYMLTHQNEFDAVDLDPYGSPSVFLDSAVQSVADGGILMCTATDMAVLCGNNGEVCHSKYGSYPVKGKYCHEMALRILLACIENHANRYKRYIVPILSVYMDFYVRVFVRIYTSASAIKETPLKLSYVYQCVGCDSFHLQSLGRTVCKDNSVKSAPGYGPVVPQKCSDCGKRFNMGGPIWSAPIHDKQWINSILANVKAMKERYPAFEKISAVLTTISEELDDVPLFVSLHSLCSTLKCTSPSAVVFRSAVINAGFRISGSHVDPLGLKTDAPMDVIWDIMRCWVKNHPVKAQQDNSGTAILAKEPKLQANFARAAASLSKAKVKKEARYLPNPERHWGPKVKAGRQITSKHSSLLGPDIASKSLGKEAETEAHKVEQDELIVHSTQETATKRQKTDC